MKILVNCTDIRSTGVGQVSASFLNECRSFTENEYVIFISPYVKRNIGNQSFPSNFRFYEFDETPLLSLRGWPIILKMKKIEAEEKPDVTFTIFGPSYWRPKSPHLIGYGYAHYIYPKSPFFGLISFREKFDVLIRKWLHVTQLKKNGDYFVCETDDVKVRWASMYNIPKDNVFVVYNTASEPFLSYNIGERTRNDNEFRFYTLCSPYRHKNLEILNEVCPLIPDLNLSKKVKFYTTFPEDSFKRIFNEETRKYIVNVGPQIVTECPKIVNMSDALFLPTLLECYSASYPEAMSMGKPILTSNLPFATTVCENAALYFDPLNAKDIANKIKAIVERTDLYTELQQKGKSRLKVFGTAKDRAQSYLNICENIIKRSIIQ